MEREIIWITTTIVFLNYYFTVKWFSQLLGSVDFASILLSPHLCLWEWPSINAKLIWRQKGGKKLYLPSQILVCIYSNTIKNSRVSQLTFGKVHRRLLFCLLLWEACWGGNMFWWKYCLKSPNVKLCNIYASVAVLKPLWSTPRATWE